MTIQLCQKLLGADLRKRCTLPSKALYEIEDVLLRGPSCLLHHTCSTLFVLVLNAWCGRVEVFSTLLVENNALIEQLFIGIAPYLQSVLTNTENTGPSPHPHIH